MDELKKLYEFKPLPVGHEIPKRKKEHMSWGKPRPWWKKVADKIMNKSELSATQEFSDWMQKQTFATTSSVMTPTFGSNEHPADKLIRQYNKTKNPYKREKIASTLLRRHGVSSRGDPNKEPLNKENWHVEPDWNSKKTELKKQIRNPWAVAATQAKKMGYKDFSEGNPGREKRGEIAESLKEKGLTKADIFLKFLTKHYGFEKKLEPPRKGLVWKPSTHRWGKETILEKHLTDKIHTHRHAGEGAEKHYPTGQIIRKHNPKSGVRHIHPGPGKGKKKRKMAPMPARPSYFSPAKKEIQTYQRTKRPSDYQKVIEAFRRHDPKEKTDYLSDIKHPSD